MIAHQERAQLVDALDDLAAEQARLGLDLPVRHLQLAYAQHRVVAGVVGVVHGRPVGHAIALAHREVIGERDRFAVGDAEADQRPADRRPRAHLGGAAGLVEIDRAARSRRMLAPVGRQPLLVRAPAELGRLQAFADEAGHAPGVDELAGTLGPAGDLRVVLGDVDHLGAGPLRQAAFFTADPDMSVTARNSATEAIAMYLRQVTGWAPGQLISAALQGDAASGRP